MIKGIVVSHGALAEELLASVIQIVGPAPDAYAISNSGKSLEQLREIVSQAIGDGGEAVIFVDFYGSAYSAAKAVSPNLPVISGVNMPMLLSFFTKRNSLSLSELIDVLIADGKRGISISKTN